MTNNTDIIAAGKQRLAYLDILDLASAVEEDEFRTITYTFTTPVATIQLIDSTLDGDVTVSVFVTGQDTPLLYLELIGCKNICAVDDKRGRYMEFLGQLKIGEYSRGSSRKETGFRLYLEPFVRLEPYFKSGA
ncbi:hypothetical protein ACO0LG_16080 [Undibacterium sp. Ji42W]|uniref:hypothetical protein n=1 Tax=Undibacterium sp. Ji42W TaxID=3413039 RepID=UPI003BF1716F